MTAPTRTGRPTGRPSKLTHRIRVPALKTGDPDRIVTCGDYVIERMEATGRAATRCASLIPVDPKTIGSWMSQGREAEDKQADGKLLTPVEQRFLDFLLATRRAHDLWCQRQLSVVDSLAAGGLSETKEVLKLDTTRKADGSAMTDTDRAAGATPFVVERKVETKRLLPDFAAVKFQLERLARDEFTPRVEHTGADGSPLVPEGAARSREQKARDLIAELDELDTFLMGVEDGRAREAETSKNGTDP